MTDLDGKVSIVTGAAGGIGGAIATAFRDAGATVALWDMDGAKATDIAHALGDGAVAIEVDITARDSVEQALATTEDRLGVADVLVNNAGIDVIEPFLVSEEATWERVVAVNFLGTVRCCHVVLPGMVERQRGRIVNIASDAGRVGSSGEAVYSGTKGGVIAFSKALARETASAGVVSTWCVRARPTPRCWIRSRRRARSCTTAWPGRCR